MTFATDTFLNAWYAWDDRAGQEETAIPFEDLCRDLALELGIPTTELRILLATLRNAGMEHEEALAGAIDAYNS